MVSRTPIGGLLLDAGEGWAFSVRGGTVAGKLLDYPGIFRLATLAPNQLPQPFTHERCVELATRWVGADEADPPRLFDREQKASATGPYGAASFLRGKDLVTLWYCTRPAGFILGAYACPADFGRTPDARVIRARCARMIGSAVFDRTAWGSQDELTKVILAAGFAEPPAEPAPQAPPPTAIDPAPPLKAAPPKRRRG